MNTAPRIKCAKAVEIIAKAVWKSDEQTGDEAVNEVAVDPLEGFEASACELRINLWQRPGLQ